MSTGTTEHAFLAQDSYADRSRDVGENKKPISIGGCEYRILDTYTNPITGYQGTAYQRLDDHHQPTGDIVIAHRGTESILDDAVDAGMVLTGINSQIPDAEKFTQRVLNKAKQFAENNHLPFDSANITVTGHSLGGTLAEYTAHKFHLHGETFNAYGAAGLLHGVPEGGTQVLNYVRATDVVSAASRHYGEVRVLATERDIARLHDAGYHEDGRGALRNTVAAIDVGAHGIINFVPDAQGHSALDPENAQRYRDHHAMVDRYRGDVLTARTAISAKWELEKKASELGEAAGKAFVDGTVTMSKAAGEAAAQGAHIATHAAEQVGKQVAHNAQQAAHVVGATYDATRDAVTQHAKATGQAAINVGKAASHEAQELGRAALYGAKEFGREAALVGSAMTANWLHSEQTTHRPSLSPDGAPTKPAATTTPVRLDNRDHPGHTMFRQGLDGVQQLNAKHGVAPSPRDSNIAGALTVEATAKGLGRIDHVLLNDDASRVFAVQGRLGGITGLEQQWAHVDTMKAIKTPLEQSSARFPQAVQQGQEQQQTQAQVQQPAPQPTMGVAR
nr:XVIPCD domain-containing protein [Dyella sp. ASV24]